MQVAELRIAKWGNSFAIRLPADLVRELNLSAGDSIDIPVGLIRKAIPKMTNEEAIAGIEAIRKWKVPEGYKFDREEANAR
jgi:antitoxin MazE